MSINATSGFANATGTCAASVLTLTSATFPAFTQAQVDSADRMRITVDTAAIRYTYDGLTVVSATVGHIIGSAVTQTIDGNANIQNFQMIRQTGTSAGVSITLEK